MKLTNLQKIEDYMNRDQERICTSPSSHILIAGVAGSRKTDTMIRLGLRRHLLEKKHLLFLTQIGSVTDEIRNRIGNYLGKPIFKFGGGNHFLIEHESCTIEIANFDAWVHRQLEDCEWSLLKTMGGFHHFKAKSLLDICEQQPHLIKGFSLKNGTYADEILVDECQDFEGLKATLLISMLNICPKVRSVFAGDKMQTLFEHSLLTEHPMTLFRQLNPTLFHLTKCFRCPKSHIKFCNSLLNASLIKHGCKKLVPIIKQGIHKPFLFTHGSVTKTFEVYQLVRQLVDMLSILCQQDATIVPSDVCFLMRKSNDQRVFDFLRMELETFWSKKGYINSVIHFATQQDGYRTPIQWEFAENKSCLISIHGDKGKGHKVVFFLGLSQGSLPEECALYKPRELIFDSLLNVALTRSTKYLFIGFHFARPSSYFFPALGFLKEIAYCSWNIEKNTPKLYQKLATVTTFPPPLFDQDKRQRPILVPSLWLTSIKDVVRSFERVEDLLGYHPKIQTIVFGKRIRTCDLSSDLLTRTSNLMLWFKVNPQAFFAEIEQWKTHPILFSENDRLICLVKDYQLNRLVGSPLYRDKLKELKESAHVDLLKPLEENQGYVFSARLRPFLQQILGQFMEKNENTQIPLSLWFSLCYLFSEVYGNYCIPTDIPKEFDVSRLFSNVEGFYKLLSEELDFHIHHEMKATIFDEKKLDELGFEKETDKSVYEKGYSFGLSTESDVLDRKEKIVYLLKASPIDLAKEWILQSSVGSCIPLAKSAEMNIEKVGIVNMILGKLYVWEKPHLPWKTVLPKLLSEISLELVQLLLASNHKKLFGKTG